MDRFLAVRAGWRKRRWWPQPLGPHARGFRTLFIGWAVSPYRARDSDFPQVTGLTLLALWPAGIVPMVRVVLTEHPFIVYAASPPAPPRQRRTDLDFFSTASAACPAE